MSVERDRKKMLRWLKDECLRRNIPYVTALEWWFTHQKPRLGAPKAFEKWMDYYHNPVNT